jgi:hypothetical protein
MDSIEKPPQNPPQSPTQNPLDRLKVLVNSSMPIVVMETVEEVRALSLVRTACSQLSLALFEWTVADGLVRSSSGATFPQAAANARTETRVGAIPQGSSEADRLARAVLSQAGSGADASPRGLPCTTRPTPCRRWRTLRP